MHSLPHTMLAAHSPPAFRLERGVNLRANVCGEKTCGRAGAGVQAAVRRRLNHQG